MPPRVTSDGIEYVRLWAEQTPIWPDAQLRQQVQEALARPMLRPTSLRGNGLYALTDPYAPESLARILQEEQTAVWNFRGLTAPIGVINRFLEGELPPAIERIKDASSRAWAAERRLSLHRYVHEQYEPAATAWRDAVSDQEWGRPELFQEAGNAVFDATLQYDHEIHAAQTALTSPDLGSLAAVAVMNHIVGTQAILGLR